MESKSLIYAPNWVKALSLVVLVVALAGAVTMAAYYVGQKDRQDWILISMSLAQAAASGLVIGVVVFFSERDVNVAGLQRRCEQFLLKTVPDAFLLIDYPLGGFADYQDRSVGRVTIGRLRRKSRTRVDVAHSEGDTAAFYRVHALGGTLHMLVKVNVWEVVVSYYFPARSADDETRILERMDWAFAGYTRLDTFTMSSNVDAQPFDETGNLYVAVHFKKEYDAEFLENERAKLFFVQMVAALTRSLIREAHHQGVALTPTELA